MEKEIDKILNEMKVNVDKTIEKFIPKKFNKKILGKILEKTKPNYDIESLNKSIAIPAWDYLERGGKRWRPVLFLLIYDALKGKYEKVLDFAILPELIHLATIIHDDIEDRSKKRRGKRCLHLIYGEDVAINLGDVLFFLPFLSLRKNRHKVEKEKLLKIYEICLGEMLKLSVGQATDICWHKGMDGCKNVTEAKYMEMAANKTGAIARTSAKLAACLAGKNEKEGEMLGKIAEKIGIAFQIQDDVLNLVGEEFVRMKGEIGEDIREGKISLPIVYTLQKASKKDRERIIKILSMHTRNKKLIEEAINIVKKYGCIELAKRKADELFNEAISILEKIIPDQERNKKLKAFVHYLAMRKV